MNSCNKKVLIISHNPLSRVNNNGKTLTSIFKGLPNENIYQIYLSSDLPDYSNDCHYYQINEKQIIASLANRDICGKEVVPYSDDSVGRAEIRTGNFANHSKRLLREMIWKTGKWKKGLSDWLQDKNFDVVFFMAGDGLFAYDIYFFVSKHITAKRCMFFTDDYVIGRTSFSPIASLRRTLLKKKINKALDITENLYVISEEMRNTYKELFSKDGYIIRNFSVEKKDCDFQSNPNSAHPNKLIMIYAGGLHYNRWKVLSQIAQCLKELNASNDVKCFLKIYSSQDISADIINSISTEGASEFCGGVSGEQIADVYANADILLHVESFEKKAIASTKYSFSTKIPEYLSANKCVLAVGPQEIASMRFLSKCACAVCENDKLFDVLSKIVSDSVYRKTIADNCESEYEAVFSPQRQAECLDHILSPIN